MKKLLLMLCLCGTFIACGEKKSEDTTAATTGKKVHLTFATQEVGTGAYQYASAISNIFLKDFLKVQILTLLLNSWWSWSSNSSGK